MGPDAIMFYDCDLGELWILSDSRSAVHLSSWSSSKDETSVSILVKPRKISHIHDVHLQWIPSHVKIRNNETVDRLVKVGSENEAATVALRSLIKNFTLMQDPN
ncbi:hypothetical protein TNCV_1019431 [Trichonephila clavipes]|nr:hypothetical protein TNCV_1019431 [Trichonephila clavipes]